jgi:glutamyl-tRNA synthetase
MHIGNLRTALYAYLIARHAGGTFVLRIEDTDRKRHVRGTEQVIYDSLRLAGLEHDEGPDVGGNYGPYVQSQRVSIYREHAERLVASGAAYRCFCTSGEAGPRPSTGSPAPTALRDPCRYLPPAVAEVRAARSEPHVIRQRIPDEGSTTFVDHIYGAITFANDVLDDQVLLKSDGLPTYNFANVVDDHLMAITHVVRGVDYLSSTPKYNLLYEEFAWEVPEYIHVPLIVKESGKKFSKRAGDSSFQDLLARGYLPQAIVNYVALLGWNPGTDREFFSLADLVQAFDFRRINKSSAGFSIAKLDWLNGEHLRGLDQAEFASAARAFYPPALAQSLDTVRISRLIQARVVHLTDIPSMVAFFVELPDYPVDLFVSARAKSSLESSRLVLASIPAILSGLPEWTNDALAAALASWGKEHALKTGTVMWPVRIALSGLEVTPGGATEIAEVLGRDETLRRVAMSLTKLAAAPAADQILT